MWIYFCETEPVDGSCPDAMWLRWSDLASFSVSQLDPQVLASAFGSGFIIVGTAFAIGRGARVLISMVGR